MLDQLLGGGIEQLPGGKSMVKKAFKGLEKHLKQQYASVELQEGETKAFGIVYEEEGVIMYALVTGDSNNKIKRFIDSHPLVELIMKSL